MKKYLTGITIIFFTLLLAFSGLLLPGFLLDQQQNSLFSKTETIYLPTADSSSNKTFIRFSPEQFFPIAISYGEVLDWNPYNSSDENLSTEYLIQTTNEQIEQLCQRGILPEIFSSTIYTWERIERGTTWGSYETDSRSASLITPETEKQTKETKRASGAATQQDYNGWIFDCGNNDLTIYVHVNASSGQILNLDAYWTENRSTGDPNFLNSASEISKQYLNYLELEDIPYQLTEGSPVLCRFEDYQAMLVVELNHYDREETEPFDKIREQSESESVYWKDSCSLQIFFLPL